MFVLLGGGLAGGGLVFGCSSFSGTNNDPVDGSITPPGQDGSVPDSGAKTGADAASHADAHAPGDAGNPGCAAIDAAACFDFDNVPTAASNWSSLSTNIAAAEPLLSASAFSFPNAARFELPPLKSDGGVRPYELLLYNDNGLPTSMEAKVRVEPGTTQQDGYLVAYDFRSAMGGNAIDAYFNCSTMTCVVEVVAYTNTGDAGTGSIQTTPLPCGTFVRGTWAKIAISLSAMASGGRVTCAINGKLASVATPSFGARQDSRWQVGVGDENTGATFGGQILYFDDVAFR
jgi:hypothetical protein